MSESEPIYEIIECDDVLYTIIEVGTDVMQVENYQEVGNSENYEGMRSELDLEEVTASEFMEMNNYDNLDHMGSQYIQSEALNAPDIHMEVSTGYSEHQKDQQMELEATTKGQSNQRIQSKKPLKRIAPNPSKIYHCSFCKMSFSGIDSYRNHWQSSHEPFMSLSQQEDVNPLDLVEAEYQEASVLEQLLDSQEFPNKKFPQSKYYVCSHCKTYFVSVNTFLEHYNEYHLNSSLDHQETTHEELSNESQNALYLKAVEAPSGTLMATLSEIKPKHWRERRNRKFLFCPTCTYYLTNIYEFHFHRKAHNFQCNEFFCELCNTNFEVNAIEAHMKAHEEKKNVAHEKKHCGYCDKGYVSEISIIKHLLDKHGIVIKICKFCLNLYEEEELQKHIDEVHGTPTPPRCENCGMKFDDESGLTLHYEMYGRSEGRCSEVIVIDDDD